MEGLAPRQPTPQSFDVGQEASDAGPIGLVFSAEGLAGQPLPRRGASAPPTNNERPPSWLIPCARSRPQPSAVTTEA